MGVRLRPAIGIQDGGGPTGRIVAGGGGQVEFVTQGNLPTSEVIGIGDPVAPGVLAAGLLPREIVGVAGAVAQRIHARRHAVGIGRVHRGGDEAQRIGDAGLVSVTLVIRKSYQLSRRRHQHNWLEVFTDILP